MRLDVRSTLSLAILSIVNMCLCLQDLAEKTLNSLGTELMQAARVELAVAPAGHDGKMLPPSQPRDFLLVDHLADGEIERRISYDGLTAKATSIGNSTNSLHLWQLTNGVAFIQMIYSKDDELIDCEHVRQKNFVSEFLTQFYDEIATARSRNFTAPPPHQRRHHRPSAALSETLRDFQLITGMTERYESAVDTVGDDHDDDDDSGAADAFGMRTVLYRELHGKRDIPADLVPLMRYGQLKRQCDERHRQMKRIVHEMQSGESGRVEAATEHLERKKRSLNNWMLVPNTKWCGRGQSATAYNQLGGASKADKCCRRHDLCKFNIHALTTKWHMFNYRPFTISHCTCDMRFRTCLKMAGSSDATMVGKLFFNIVQTKCFVIKPEKSCKKWSWWGRCEKPVIKKRAHLRDNRKF